MTKRRRSDSLARSKPPGTHGLTAAALNGWPSVQGILFALPFRIGYPNTYWAGTVG